MKNLILIITCCLVTQCGSFNAAYTDPKTGATFHGGIDAPPIKAVYDNK